MKIDKIVMEIDLINTGLFRLLMNRDPGFIVTLKFYEGSHLWIVYMQPDTFS